jgi:DNA-binding GntR family transcriptional regulator
VSLVHAALNPVEPAADASSVAQRIERALLRAIVTMELAPGAKLSEQELAERYGVSRQPVREALLALGNRGLVATLPRRGTMVVKISVELMMQVRFVREALEVAVVRRACDRFSSLHRSTVDMLLRAQTAAAEANDHDAFLVLDERFHATLAAGSGCDLAWRTVLDIKCHMDRVCQLTIWDSAAQLALVAQHRAIVEAIDRRDAEAAETAMRHHLTEILRAIPRVVAERGELFE